MHVLDHTSFFKRIGEVSARGTALEADVELGSRTCLCDIPKFSFRFTAEFFGRLGRWVHLDR